MNADIPIEPNSSKIEGAVERICKGLPKQVRYRAANSIENIRRSYLLLDDDLEMSSFRAITSEEEAASAIMHAVRLRAYAGAKSLNPKNHDHKNAVIVCFQVIAQDLQPLLKEFQLLFDFAEQRIDVKIPLSVLGVKGGDDVALQPIEPLDFLHARQGMPENEVFMEAINNLPEKAGAENLRQLVKSRANQRNTLLYASDESLPQSRADRKTLDIRRDRAISLLVLSVMILQSKEKLALVRQAVATVSAIVERLSNER